MLTVLEQPFAPDSLIQRFRPPAREAAPEVTPNAAQPQSAASELITQATTETQVAEGAAESAEGRSSLSAVDVSSGLPDALFAIGIALLCATLMRMVWVRRRKKSGAHADISKSELSSTDRLIIDTRDRINEMVASAHDTVRQLTSALEQRAARLESLIEQTDAITSIAASAASTQSDEQPDTQPDEQPEPEPESTAEPESASVPEPNTESEPDPSAGVRDFEETDLGRDEQDAEAIAAEIPSAVADDTRQQRLPFESDQAERRAAVFKLADEGLDAAAIAKQLERSEEDVRLTLLLPRPGEAS
ncbi:MAG: hypothetical protein AAGI17_04510 [Planctomycetota bacterium]